MKSTNPGQQQLNGSIDSVTNVCHFSEKVNISRLFGESGEEGWGDGGIIRELSLEAPKASVSTPCLSLHWIG